MLYFLQLVLNITHLMITHFFLIPTTCNLLRAFFQQTNFNKIEDA